MKLSTSHKIIQVLLRHPWTAGHEFSDLYRAMFYEEMSANENAIGTRCPEIAKWGYVINGKKYKIIGRKRKDKTYCEWDILSVEDVEIVKPKPSPVEIKEPEEIKEQIMMFYGS